MTSRGLNAVAYILVLFSLWGLVLLLLHRVEQATLWRTNWQGGPGHIVALRLTQVAASSIPFMSLFVTYHGRSFFFSEFQSPGLIMILNLMGGILFLRWREKSLHCMGGWPCENTLAKSRSRLEVSPWCIITILFFLPIPLLSGTRPLLILAFLGFLHLRSRIGRKKRAVGTFKVEEVPLLKEIRTIANESGRSVTQVYATNWNLGGRWSPKLFDRDRSSEERYQILVLSCQAMRELSPDAFTAGVALIWSRRKLARWLTRLQATVLGKIAGGCAFLVILYIGLVAMVIMNIFLSGIMGSGPGSFLLFPLSLSVLVLPISWLGVRRYLASYTNAWIAWAAGSALQEERTPEQFNNAIAEHHRYVERIRDPELVVHQLFLSPAFLKWLNVSGIPRTEAKAEMLQHLREQTIVCGRNAGVAP